MPPDQTNRQAAERFPFDQIYKAMCGHPATIRDMLRNHLSHPRGPLSANTVAALDMRTVRRLSTEWVTRDFRARRGDLVFSIDFREAARNLGYPERLFLHSEHQSNPDRDMASRFLEYGNELRRELRTSGVPGASNDACPILCVLIYNGRSPWTAPTRTVELGPLLPVFGTEPAMPDEVAAFHPRGYHVIGLAGLGAEAPIPGSVVSLMAGIETASRRGLAESFRTGPLARTWLGLDTSLRRTAARWVWRLAKRHGVEAELEDLMQLEEIGKVTSLLEATLDAELAEARDRAIEQGIAQGMEQGMEQGMARGMEQGMAQGQRALLRSQAALRFGERTASRLDELLGSPASPEALRQAGGWILECVDADDLLRRVARAIQAKAPRG